ncbi:MAG TPA: DUF3562 domain-containing protein [Thermodesulfobacteriota bacterium]|nr:DUF3562 domain-containing protein [Thermodesulfobacteriota bacterium]
MNDLVLYEDETEQKQHSSAIQRLVKEVRSSEEEIRPLYEGVLKEFKSGARINTFLSILVSKRVKELFHERRRVTRQIENCA